MPENFNHNSGVKRLESKGFVTIQPIILIERCVRDALTLIPTLLAFKKLTRDGLTNGLNSYKDYRKKPVNGQVGVAYFGKTG